MFSEAAGLSTRMFTQQGSDLTLIALTLISYSVTTKLQAFATILQMIKYKIKLVSDYD